MLTEQSSSEAKTGSTDTTQFKLYLGKLSEVVQKAAVNPRSRLTGTVWVKFKVSPSGDLISREVKTSSGSKVLDDAAIAAIERAAPFPPIPREASNEPVTISVPFKFVTR
jgi:periplasmic protein TonB